VSSVAPATVAPTQVPGGTVTLPDTGDGGSRNSGVLVGLTTGIATLGLLLVMGRVRSMRAPRYRGRP
jgi:LPXTG-motif cell wall-anchored protein